MITNDGKLRWTQKIRQATGLTLTDFAKKFPNAKLGTLQGYASGKTPTPAGLLARIAEAAGVTLDWLVLDRGPMRPGEPARPAIPAQAVALLQELREGQDRALALIDLMLREAEGGEATGAAVGRALERAAAGERKRRRGTG